MTTLATDNFAGTGALSANWSVLTGTVSRSSDECLFAATQIAVASYIGVDPPDDHWAQCVVGSQVDPTSDNGIWLLIRCTDANNFYLFQVNANESRIYRRLGGGFAQLGVDGPGVSAGDTMYFEAQGSQLVAKINSTTVCGSPTDSNHTAGTFGIGCGSTAAITLDDWAGGDFVSAGGGGQPPRSMHQFRMRRAA